MYFLFFWGVNLLSRSDYMKKKKYKFNCSHNEDFAMLSVLYAESLHIHWVQQYNWKKWSPESFCTTLYSVKKIQLISVVTQLGSSVQTVDFLLNWIKLSRIYFCKAALPFFLTWASFSKSFFLFFFVGCSVGSPKKVCEPQILNSLTQQPGLVLISVWVLCCMSSPVCPVFSFITLLWHMAFFYMW